MERGYLIDRATQLWVRVTGRRIDLRRTPWLDGPVGSPRLVGEQWLNAEAQRSHAVLSEQAGAGLVPDMAVLNSDVFSRNRLRPEVIDFYEHTSDWSLELWSQWRAAFWPLGWILSTVFARRLRQFNLPLRPLDTSRGVRSRIVSIVDASGQVSAIAWLRTLRATGETIYSGCYSTVTLPGKQSRSIRVVFPLPSGSLTIFLRPEIHGPGNLRLVSPLGRFGDDGAYLVVREGCGPLAWVRRVPFAEQFDIYTDVDGVTRTDHIFRLWKTDVIQFHYRLDHVQV